MPLDECEDWILDERLDPTTLELGKAILEIVKAKEKAGHTVEVVKSFNELKIYRKSETYFIYKDNKRYSILKDIDAKSMELPECLGIV